MSGFIGVHIGAGCHSEKFQIQYEKLCRRACRKATDVLKSGGSALEAATTATRVLEDSILTNAGVGSNLTWDGQVECDASVMDGSTLLYGAVGAVSGVKNPVVLAQMICEAQTRPLSLDRIPPCLLVGPGANQWAQQNGIQTVNPVTLITDKAYRYHHRYKRKAVKGEIPVNNVGKVVSRSSLDTVGAVCVDTKGRVAAACSSGGILLKQPGRVGQAGIYGCGCWAENGRVEGEKSVAATVSGCGEDLIKTFLAKETAQALRQSSCPTIAVNDTIRHQFLESPFLFNDSQKLCGVIGVETNGNGGEFVWAHTTESMGVGYMSTDQPRPKSRISRLPEGVPHGSTVMIEGIFW